MPATALRVLTYHRIVPDDRVASSHPSLVSATASVFAEQMRVLARGYAVVGVEQVLAAIHDGQRLPRRPVLITFDDAYRDFADVAWPVLRSFGFPATLFVPTAFPGHPDRVFWWDRLFHALSHTARDVLDAGPCGRFRLHDAAARQTALLQLQTRLKRMPHRETLRLVEQICRRLGAGDSPPSQVLGWDELRALAADGVTIAAHTRNHPALDGIAPADARQEIRGSLEDVRREIGHASPVIAYPYGRHDDGVVRLAREAGIRLAVTCATGHQLLPPRDPLRVRRINVSRRTTPGILAIRLTRAGDHLDRWRHRRRERSLASARLAGPAAAPATAPVRAAPRVAYIMSRFPKLSETFILYEMAALEQLGVDVHLYPLRRARQPVAHPETDRWVPRARFLPFVSAGILRANAHFLVHRPRAYLGLWRDVLRETWGSPGFFLGALAFLPKAAAFALEMRRDGVQHVHAHFATHPALAAFAISRLAEIPFSFTGHGSDLHVDRRMLPAKVAAAAFVVTVSRYNRDLIIRECGEWAAPRVRVVHCGADLQVFVPATSPARPGTDEPFRIVCVASLEEVKGHRYLIQACRLLQDRGIELECLLIGDGPGRRRLADLINRADLAGRVHLLGGRPRPDVVQALAHSHAAVLASCPTADGRREGIPVALMEAMAASLPVVASGISGIPELVEHERTGILVPPANAAALADALERLARDPTLRRRMGDAGREKVRREFDLFAIARELCDLILAEDSPRPATEPGPAAAPASPGAALDLLPRQRIAPQIAMPNQTLDPAAVRRGLDAIRPAAGLPAEIAVVVPVNAQGDLDNVVRLLADVAAYTGPHTVETILVVNNFPENQPPPELEALRALGARVLAIPNTRRPGEAPGFSARIPGIREASAPFAVLLDADCRVRDVSALLDWYAVQFRKGAHAAYTHVAYYDYEDAVSIHFRFFVHHAVRWVKRALLGIPTTRGSNYAVRCDSMLELYEAGMLADEMNVGPTMKHMKGPVAYSGRRRLVVYTSGRMFRPGWKRIFPYLMYRLRYNFRVLRVRQDMASCTGRENDPVRRYVGNRPVEHPE